MSTIKDFLTSSNPLLSFTLVFMLITALVFGILKKSRIFDNKKADIIVAAVLGIMAGSVTLIFDCTKKLFSNTIIGLITFLVLILMMGLFLSEGRKKEKGIFIGLVTLGLIIIFYNAIDECGLNFLRIDSIDFTYIFLALFVIGMIVWIISGSKNRLS